MNNTVLGAILAAVLVAALFAAAIFFKKPAVNGMDDTRDPKEAANSLKDDFVGQQKIGQWTLVCEPVQELRRPPPSGQSGNSSGAAPKEAPPPPHWHRPRCRVVYSIPSNADPKQEKLRVTFREFGFKRTIAMFLRFFPVDETESIDSASVDFDTTQWSEQVQCARVGCLAGRSIKFAELPVVNRAKSFKVRYTPAGSQEKVTVPLPTRGLAEAIAALRRIDT